MLETKSNPKFVIPHKDEVEWGQFFCDTAARIIAVRGGNSIGRAVDEAVRSAASLTEALIELSENQ